MQRVRNLLIVYQRYFTRIFKRFLHQLHKRYFHLFKNKKKTRRSRFEKFSTITKSKIVFEH